MKTSTRLSLGGCAWLSLTWGLGCPVGVGGRALPWGVGPAVRWVCALGKYLDPAGDRDLYGPRTRHMGSPRSRRHQVAAASHILSSRSQSYLCD